MGRILGIDYGVRRIGLAISDPTKFLATHFGVIDQKHENAFTRIQEIIHENNIISLVIGMPFHMNGKESDLSTRVRAFSEKLLANINIPIYFLDERLTSKISEAYLFESGIKKKKHKDKIDEGAAAIILQDYLDAN